MKIFLLFTPGNNKKGTSGTLLAGLMLCLLCSLIYILPATAGTINNHKRAVGAKPAKKTQPGNKKNVGLFAGPTISYSSPQMYLAGSQIAPLAPVSSGVGAAGYSNLPIIRGSSANIGGRIATDSRGNVYFSNMAANSVQKMPAGGGTVTTVATGFTGPGSVAIDGSDNIYVIDNTATEIKERVNRTGHIITLATGFQFISDIAADAAGNVFVTEYSENAIIEIPAGSPAGTKVVLPASTVEPYLITVDGYGNIYFIDSTSGNIKMIPAAGGQAVYTALQAVNPYGLVVDAQGDIFTSDRIDGYIIEYPGGNNTPLNIGTGNFGSPGPVTVDFAGNIYVNDTGSSNLDEIKPLGGYYMNKIPPGLNFSAGTGILSGIPTTPQGVTTYTVTAYNNNSLSASATINITVNAPPAPTITYNGPQKVTAGYAGSNVVPATTASSPLSYGSPVTLASGFYSPHGIGIDAAGNVYVADWGYGLVQKIPAGGGTAVTIGSGFSKPQAIAVDAAGNVYIADSGTKFVYKIPATNSPMTTIGSGFNAPTGVAVDAAGNVFVADSVNKAIYKVMPGQDSNPLIIAAGVNDPHGVAVDAAGNVYCASIKNGQVFKISPVGGLVTIYSAFAGCAGVTVDNSGNVFISNIYSRGFIELPADGSPAITIGDSFDGIYGAVVDQAGNLYGSDIGSGFVRELKQFGGFYVNPSLPAGLTFNNTTGVITGAAAATGPAANYTVTAYNGVGVSANTTLNLTVVPESVSYATPVVFTAGVPISPLAPTTNGTSSAAYSNGTLTHGTGFSLPYGIAVDAQGNIYVGDSGNSLVKKVAIATDVTTSLGSGFNTPCGVALDASGNIYVADFGNNEVKEIPAGSNTPVVLGYGFSSPIGVAVDAQGNVYVADKGSNSVKKITTAGVFVLSSSFSGPSGVAVDASGNVYVADYGNNAIKEIPANGDPIITLASGFSSPEGVAVDREGNIFVADNNNNTLKEIPAGTNSVIIISNQFNHLSGVAIDGAGNLYVADQHNNQIKQLHPIGGFYTKVLPPGLTMDNNTGIISGTPAVATAAVNYKITAYTTTSNAAATINIQVNTAPAITVTYPSPSVYTAGDVISPLTPTSANVETAGYRAVPVVVSSALSAPYSVATDLPGNIYVADLTTNTVNKIPAAGGSATVVASGFNSIGGIAADAAGDVFVADAGAGSVIKIPAGGGAKVTVAGGFNIPSGLAVDVAGNIYVADFGNNVVKKIPAAGGSPVAIGFGFSGPTGVAVDAAGNVYVADKGNNAVKEIPLANGTPFLLGSGFNAPVAVAVDAIGNVYVADTGNNAISEIPAGNGTVIRLGSGFNNPSGVTFSKGVVFVSDYGYSQVKKIMPAGGFYINKALPKGLSFDITTGIISGTPMAGIPATTFIVTAYNVSNNKSVSFNITVNTPPVPTLRYPSPDSYYVLAAMSLTPAATGIAPVAFNPGFTAIGGGFNQPDGLALDAAGDVFVADAGSNLIKKIAPNGVISGYGTGLNLPAGVTVDAAGNIYIADQFNHAVEKIAASGGAQTTLSSAFVGPTDVKVDASVNVYVDDFAGSAIYMLPSGGGAAVMLASGYESGGIALDPAGNLYASDTNNGNIWKIPAGGGKAVLYSSGLGGPFHIALDPSGNLFVTDGEADVVYMVPPGGGAPVLLLSGFQNVDGIATDGAGNLYVSDNEANTVSLYKPVGGYYINSPVPAGLTFNSSTGAITGTPPAISLAANYTVTAYNKISVSTQASINIQVVMPPAPVVNYNPAIFTKGVAISPAFTPTGSNVYPLAYASGKSPVTSGLNFPFGVAVDGQNTVYIADETNSSIIKVPYQGTKSTIGSGFSTPAGVAVDRSGNVYVADYGNNAIKMIPVGGGATVSLGSGFNGPVAVAIDWSGNIYVADRNNNAVKKIITGTNIVVPIASGFNEPSGVAVDPAGNVYVADFGNGLVKEIPSGTNTTVTIGSGFVGPEGVAVDNTGDVYVTDISQKTVFFIPSYGGGPIAVSTGYAGPTSAAVDGSGFLYVADLTAKQVYQITPVGGYFSALPFPAGIIFNSSTGAFTGTPTQVSASADYDITGYNVSGVTFYPLALSVIGNANLSGLTLSTGTLSPVFASGTTSYTASVSNATSSITITPTAADATAAIKVNGVNVTSGAASGAIALNVGSNTITTVVTAQDGTTTKTYTLTLTRVASANANLASMGPSISPLTPAFAPGTTSYTLNVSSASASMTVKPVASDANATIKVNGTAILSGTTSGPIALAPGAQTTITTVVTAEDGATTKTYTITVTRASSANDNLSSLKLSAGVLSPVFASSTASYMASVPNSTASITVTPTTTDANAAVTVNGTVVTSGSASGAIALNVGPNTITTIVTAQDGTTKKTYTVTLSRAPSVNANLASMGPSVTPLSPMFAPGTTSYSLNVSNTISSMTVKPVTSEANATIKVNGTTVASGSVSQAIALAVGLNTISVVVTAQDGTTAKTYTITVTRTSGGADSYDPGMSVSKPTETPVLADDGILVHQGISPNGDGVNDFLQIDKISQYPDNKLTIMNRNGQMVYEATGYDNSSKVFDGHSNKNRQMQLPGTYFYQLDYTVNGITKHKTGFIVLKY